MALKMSEFHGIDSSHVTTLRVAGIENTDDLMKIWSDKEKRAGLVASTGIAHEDFMRFAAMARLGRVKGMALQHLDALVAAGIDGPKRLFTYTPETLVKHLGEVAAEKKLAGPFPTLEEIIPWFENSKPATNGNNPKPEANPSSASVVAKLLLIFVAAMAISVGAAQASIPDADIRASSNQAGFGAFDGAYGRVEFGLSGRSAIGAYAGTDPNDLYFGGFNNGDRRFNSDLLVGGHYMYQFVEGAEGNPNVAMLAGAFANRAGLRPEFGFALSYPFADRWVGRLNAVYGPSWGLEFGYNFSPTVQGTFGLTGMGLVGLNIRF